ncbi:TPA: hypothetical protein DCX16_05015 [bacterium]|nr:hypothetical protein [bacterium]
MAEEEREEEVEKKEEKKFALPKGPIIIILSVIIGIVLIITTAIIVVNKVLKDIKTPPPIKIDEERETHLPKGPLHSFEIGEFLAKIINPEEPTYVKIEKLSLAYNKDEYEFLLDELNERKLQIRDIINTILISSTKEIETAEGKEEFKKRISDELNKILRDGQIEEVYCELIVQ